MPAERAGVAVEVLRTAVAEEAAATSIRQVAREIGVGVTTLWQFLEGSEPQRKTRRRLVDWYLARHATENAAPDAALAAAALALLTRHMPPAERRDAERRVLRVLERASGELAPEWLAALRPRSGQ